MSKKTWLLIIVFAVLVFTIFYFAVPQVKAATNKSFLGPLAGAAGGTAKAIYANPIWQTYVVPYQFLWGVVLMGVFAIVWWKMLAPRRPHIQIRKPSVGTGAGVGTGSAGMRTSTPPDATVRPETVATVETPIEEKEAEESST